jgi:hypothetical protein
MMWLLMLSGADVAVIASAMGVSKHQVQVRVGRYMVSLANREWIDVSDQRRLVIQRLLEAGAIEERPTRAPRWFYLTAPLPPMDAK